MAEYPALLLWTDAYLADTTDLTTEEHGAYLLLLMAAWRSPDCSLPDDDERLARMARLGPKGWRAVRPVMLKFWTVADGKWTQKRLLKERLQTESRRARGSKAGLASALKRQDSTSTSVGTKNQPPTPTPTPTLKKEEKISEPKGSDRPARKSRAKEPPLPLGDRNVVVPLPERSLTDAIPDSSDSLDAIAIKDIIFGRALRWLRTRSPGRSDHALRGWLGKLCRDYGEEITLHALRRAQQTSPIEVVAFVEGCCRKLRSTGGIAGEINQADPLAIAGLK